MDLTIHIPDELFTELGGEAARDQLERRALEAFALEEWKEGRITKVQLRETLGLERLELDGFFKERKVFQEDYTLEDFERERQALREAGF